MTSAARHIARELQTKKNKTKTIKQTKKTFSNNHGAFTRSNAKGATFKRLNCLRVCFTALNFFELAAFVTKSSTEAAGLERSKERESWFQQCSFRLEHAFNTITSAMRYGLSAWTPNTSSFFGFLAFSLKMRRVRGNLRPRSKQSK